MSNVDRFESRIAVDHLRVLLDLGVEFGFDPTSSVEMENYFANLVQEFRGSPSDLYAWVRPKIEQSFRCVTSIPRWIQDPDWQLSSNSPMVFVGQIDCPPAGGLFHDDASFYVFFDPTSGKRSTIVQVA
jgi:hypothetical protein